ncbi:MAG: archaellin/type IV pilin N-terminal domain-containing protein [Dehalococcoidales bacterium]
MLKKFLRHEKGITGLETAIILIAFVVVAAVFAYTALSAGLFSTQKSQEAVYSGLKEARSTLELRGPVIATANSTGSSNGTIKQISFTLANVLGGEAIDFTMPTANTNNNGKALEGLNATNKVVINYIDQNLKITNLYWTFIPLGKDNGNNLLETNEKFQITVGYSTNNTLGGNLLDALSPNYLGINKTFNLEIVTPVGAVLSIERTTPAYIDTIMNLR